MVFHILPTFDSIEYEIMRELGNKYDLVRQGILFERILNNFRGIPVEEICANMLQWFNRRLAQITSPSHM